MGSPGNKVLIIEDAKFFALAIASEIQKLAGFEILFAENLKQAKEILAAHHQSIFAATVDLNLPDANQGEAVDEVLTYEIPAVVLTGQVTGNVREEMLLKGVADYIIKEGSHNVLQVAWLIKRLYHNYGTKVLVVDDSKTARQMTCQLLEIQKYQVLEACNGEQALEIIQMHPDIRLAVLDCFMEGMDGFVLSSRIRQTHSKEQLSIIGISGNGGQALSARFIKHGANDFLLKPFLPEEFYCRINNCVEAIDQFSTLKQLNDQKNLLLGTAAHDIRGPIGIIKKASELLLNKPGNWEKSHELLHMINDNAAGMLCLLNDLLDLSAIENGSLNTQPQLSDYCQLIKERIQLYGMDAENKAIAINSDLPKCCKFRFDPMRMTQVVDNLLTNAIKYSPCNSEIKVSLTEEDHYHKLSIEDQGPGIEEEDVPKLFHPFQKLNTKTTAGESSSGLGLAICKNIVDAHQGRIGYKAKDGGGSNFFVMLP